MFKDELAAFAHQAPKDGPEPDMRLAQAVARSALSRDAVRQAEEALEDAKRFLREKGCWQQE